MYPFHRYPSSYLALLVWGTTGFMAQPTMASFLVHFLLVPLTLAAVIWIAHWEGRREGPPLADTDEQPQEKKKL